VHARHLDEAKRGTAPAGEQSLRRWKITDETVVFYFELARLPSGDAG
jgi:hypothetical protein